MPEVLLTDMSSQVVTQVTLVAKNEISDDGREQVLDDHDAESLEEVADKMEESVEALLATRVFGDADEVPTLDVNTKVEE
jgi:hypothetical protein